MMSVDKRRFHGSVGVAEWFHNLCALWFDILRSIIQWVTQESTNRLQIHSIVTFFHTISYILHKLFSWAIRLDLHFSFGDRCIWDFTPVIPSYTILPLLIKNMMALLNLRVLQVNFSTTVKTKNSYTVVVHVMQKGNAPFRLADKRYRFDYATLTIHLPPCNKAKSTHSTTTLMDKKITYSLPEKSQKMINYIS